MLNSKEITKGIAATVSLLMLGGPESRAGDSGTCLAQALKVSSIERGAGSTIEMSNAKKWACASSFSSLQQNFKTGITAAYAGIGLKAGFSQKEYDTWRSNNCIGKEQNITTTTFSEYWKTTLTKEGLEIYKLCLAQQSGPQCGLEEATDGTVRLRIAWFPNKSNQKLPKIKSSGNLNNLKCDNSSRLKKGKKFPDGDEEHLKCNRLDPAMESSATFLLDDGSKHKSICHAELPKSPNCGMESFPCCNVGESSRCNADLSCIEDKCLAPPRETVHRQPTVRYEATEANPAGQSHRKIFKCPEEYPVLKSCKNWTGEGMNAAGERINPHQRGNGTFAKGKEDKDNNACVCTMAYEGKTGLIKSRYPWVSCGVTLVCSDR